MTGRRRRIGSFVWFFAILAAVIPQAQGRPCPPVLAGLLPGGAVHVSGQYNSAGMLGLGSAAADLPFDNPCTNAVTKYPGHLTLDVKHYEGDGVALFKMQIDPEEAQRVQNGREEFEKIHAEVSGAASKAVRVSPIKMESASGGTVLYFDYDVDCSEGVKRSHPTVHLLAVAHSESTAINIEIDGFISAGAAKAAAVEVLSNFVKADFGKAGRGA